MKKIFAFGIFFFLLFTSATSCRTTVATRPQAVVVTRPPAPRPGYIWIEGDWYISRGRWVQRPGYWVAPRRGHSWSSGHWVHTGRGYYWQRGHWR